MYTTPVTMAPLHHFEILGITILVAGVFGGIVDFYLTHRTDPEEASIWKSIALGICASFLVPLFLNTISSRLFDDIRNQPDDLSKNIFLFFGFCLVAAISSKAFIQTISSRVLDEARKAKEAAKAANEKALEIQSAVEPIIEKETEGESETVATEAVVALPHLNDREWTILKALANGEKALRTRTGLGKQTGMTRDEVVSTMDALKDKALVSRKEM